MSNRSSFLPEDYVAQRAELRTNLISLVLFAVVMLSVFLAFMVTNRKWSQVKDQQTAVNAKYLDTADQIETLLELESQRGELAGKAELAAALVDRVPRSILLAEIINRMPDRLSLLEFELESEKLKAPIRRNLDDTDEKTKRLAPGRGRSKADAAKDAPAPRILPPRYEITLALTGVAPTDLEVSQFLGELNMYPLFDEVFLEFSEERDVSQQLMRYFKINLKLVRDADVRSVEPLRKSRNPMSVSDLGTSTTISP